MSLAYKVLGSPGRDNALLVEIDSGQAVERLLFDCGEGCLSGLSFAEIQSIDHLFFSHLHMDHVGGFDSFFRCTFDRATTPNRIWGPPGTAQIIQHRFQGFLWNLHDQMSATWQITDIGPDQLHQYRFELSEAFAHSHKCGQQEYELFVLNQPGYVVEALTMDHKTPTLAFILREKPRTNVDITRLKGLGLNPGPWLKQLKGPIGKNDSIVINGTTLSLADLRAKLLVESTGDSIAYLTDFLLTESVIESLSKKLLGCRTIVCESQYRHADIDLARKNFHMTTVLSATLAQLANAEELILFHLSDRYEHTEWLSMLHEAQQVFPNTRYPSHWALNVK